MVQGFVLGFVTAFVLKAVAYGVVWLVTRDPDDHPTSEAWKADKIRGGWKA